MQQPPCKNCLIFVMCKTRLYENNHEDDRAATKIAEDEDCRSLREYIYYGTQKHVNECRVLFGLEPIE